MLANLNALRVKSIPKAKILVLGESGTGKSTGARNLNVNSTAILNTECKVMPFSSPVPNFFIGCLEEFSAAIAEINVEKTVKTVVVDSYNGLHSQIFNKCKSANSGKNGFADYGQLKIMSMEIMSSLIRMDKNIVFNCVCNMDENGVLVPSIDGSMKQNLAPLFTIVLQAKIVIINDKPVHAYETVNYGSNTSKSPMGMFEALVNEFNSTHSYSGTLIENDLSKVLTNYFEFYKK